MSDALTQHDAVKISVIIPAFNEESNIDATLSALRRDESLEVIVVDNGSTDRTGVIAREALIKVIDFPNATIAAVRNRGVEEATGQVLVFLDADVRVTSQWHDNIGHIARQLVYAPNTVTGSRVSTAHSNAMVLKYWFAELSRYSAEYINSGHLITSRALFEQIGGFDENLRTSEDYDFCARARLAGASIVDDANLLVLHDGYPTSVLEFMQRERWHGSEDVSSWRHFCRSRIAWVALLNLLMFSAALALGLGGYWQAVPAYLLLMLLISLSLTVLKFGVRPIHRMFWMTVFFYVYICGRSLSIIDRLVGKRT